MRKESLNQDWLFLCNPEKNAKYRTLPEGRQVHLPHDFSMELPRRPDASGGNYMGFFQGGIGLYEKQLCLKDEWRGKKIYLEFEGVYRQASVKLNGHLIARRPNGYVSFLCDLTPWLCWDRENILQVTADNRAQPNSRWYSGSGIYRPVWLHVGDERRCISPWGIYAYTIQIDDHMARLHAQAALEGHEKNAQVCFTLMDRAGRIAAAAQGSITDDLAVAELMVIHPHSWSPDDPFLYTLRAEVIWQGQIIDTFETRLGLRTLSFDPKNGLRINGVSYKMKGGCVHHDCGILGAAAYADAEKRKVRLLKENGYNAIRCAHNPPSPAFLDACDEMGMLVMHEAFDSWRECKSLNSQDYSVFFEDWWQRDLRDMLLRDRNHPSIIMWSTGNEIIERDGRSGGYELSRALADTIRQYDRTRAITNGMCGFWGEEMRPELEDQFGTVTEEFIRPLDVAGYNYLLERYESDHKKFPDRVICCTESYSTEAQAYWEAVEKYPWVIGDFVWTAQDYFGEAGCGRVAYQRPRDHRGPWPWHQAWCGDLDICGQKRPQSYFRDCVWQLARAPFIGVYDPAHFGQIALRTKWAWPDVFPRWTWPGMEGKPTQIDIYAMEEEVELILNGQSLGRQGTGRENAYTAHFECVYIPGTIEAIGFHQGKPVSRTILQTTGAPVRLHLVPESSGLIAQKERLIYVHALVEDTQGQIVPYAAPQLTFSACGGAQIAAIGTADPISTESYRGNTRRAHQGRAMIILESTGKMEDTLLTVMADGYPPETLHIPALSPE